MIFVFFFLCISIAFIFLRANQTLLAPNAGLLMRIYIPEDQLKKTPLPTINRNGRKLRRGKRRFLI